MAKSLNNGDCHEPIGSRNDDLLILNLNLVLSAIHSVMTHKNAQ